MYFCRWDYCPRGFSTITALAEHFKADHIAHEQPVYVPAHKRRRRSDGAWILLESSFKLADDISNLAAAPILSAPPAGTGIIGIPGLPPISTLSQGTSDTSVPSFAVPTSFEFSQPFSLEEPAEVDYDAFLRSPSPAQPMQSTPASQVPLPSQRTPGGRVIGPGQRLQGVLGSPVKTRPMPPLWHESQASQAPQAVASQAPGSQASREISSADLVSPPSPRDPITQMLPPPSPASRSHPSQSSRSSGPSQPEDGGNTTVDSTNSSGSAQSPRPALAFGAGETRRVSGGNGVGFAWGQGKD